MVKEGVIIDQVSQTAQTTLTLTLTPLLEFHYAPNPNNNNQLTLTRVGHTRKFSSNPNNGYDGYGDMDISSQLDSWQLDVSMPNNARLSQGGTSGISTENQLEINLYTSGYENDPIPQATAHWPGMGEATCNMITQDHNVLGQTYVYFAKYDLSTTENDPAGTYSGVVIWTVSATL